MSKETIITTFSKFTQEILSNPRNFTPKDFSLQYSVLQKDMPTDEFCKKSEILLENLNNMPANTNEKNDFIGIIYSTLCKVNEFIPAQLEKYAIAGFHHAEQQGDYIHMMARLNNLRKLYINKPDKLYNYIQVLYKEEKCLKQLSKNYDTCIKQHNTIFRTPATQQQYETMLAYVQTEIGKLTKKKHPNDALKKLLSARQIFENQKTSNHLLFNFFNNSFISFISFSCCLSFCAFLFLS